MRRVHLRPPHRVAEPGNALGIVPKVRVGVLRFTDARRGRAEDDRDPFIAVAGAGKPVTAHDIVAFRVPGDCLIKLHANTWHAGPHFIHDECLFFNLENLGTNKRDFIAAELQATVEIADA